MRKELELMETIENYLKGKLSDADKSAFENKIKADPELKKEVELQKELMKGIERAGLKQSAKQGLKKHTFNKNLKNFGLTGLSIAIILSAVLYFNSKPEISLRKKLPDNQEVVQHKPLTQFSNSHQLPQSISTVDSSAVSENPSAIFNKVYSVKNLKIQEFTIDPGRDTILKSKAGVKIRIEKNSFVTKKGDAIKELVTINFKEALTPYEIVMANLITKTNDKVLESGGMVYLNATSNGNSVSITDAKALMISVPAKKIKRDMQIFDGKVSGNTINWIDPKPTLNGGDALDEDFLTMIEGDATLQDRGNISSFAVDNSLSYLFSLTNLGWSNIDRLANDPRTKEIELITKIKNKKDFQFIYTTIAFPNKNIFIPGYEKRDKTYSFTHGDYETTKLPMGETAVIIATTIQKDKIFLATKKIKIIAKQTVDLNMEEVTDPKLKKILAEQLRADQNLSSGAGGNKK